MSAVLPFATLALAAIAAVFAMLCFVNSLRRPPNASLLADIVARSMRDEGDRLRQSAEEQARADRSERAGVLSRFQESALDMHTKFGDGLSARVDQFAARLDSAVRNIDERVAAIGGKLEADMARMATEAAENRDRLRHGIEAKLDDASAKQNRASADFRDTIGANFETFRSGLKDALVQMSDQQRERLDATNQGLMQLIDKNERSQEALRQAVEGRLDTLRTENSAKLEEMRNTVDEKLKATLETRLGESFNRVVEQLERVHKGIGEMQTLATNVGDLKNVLSNVRVRGTYGEVQLAMLLEEFLSPEQLVKDAQVTKHSLERVEYAIKLPGKGDESSVLLPIDAKFPREDFERLIAAADSGDTRLIAEFRKALQNRIRSCAKEICQKYINPPATTNFAILFLPTESLYAEVLREPGLFEQIQREHHVTLASPTTLAALLNAFQMGFRTLAIEKRSSEVWKTLGAVRTEFGKYNKVVEQIEKQLATAQNSVSSLGRRTRVMTGKLKDVEALGGDDAERLLGLADGGDDPGADEPADGADSDALQLPAFDSPAAAGARAARGNGLFTS